MGEIHELFVLALSLVWFAGATPNMWVFSIEPFVAVADFRVPFQDSLYMKALEP